MLQPLTSCSATVTFLRCEPSRSDGGCGTQQLQSLHRRRSNIDNGSSEKKFISSVLCKMPVLSCNQGMP